uniref:Uncharacterized protein n=1 Tax=Anguilla anguilla TaxID=7936 RepID=A0A0E9PUR2_ANGAN
MILALFMPKIDIQLNCILEACTQITSGIHVQPSNMQYLHNQLTHI